MKIFKMILNCVLPTILVFSLVLNVLLLCGFEITKKTDTGDVSNITNTNLKIDTSGSYDLNTDKVDENEDNNKTDFDTNYNPDISNDESVGTLIYDDTNIKVTYLSTQEKDGNIIHNFKIENLTKKTLSIMFTDIIINGTKVYISGLTCENLLPETSTVEEFVLYEKDWNSFTEDPSDISFKIELVNSKSRLDWYESNRINMKF